MNKTTLEICYTAAMLVFAASCGCDIVIGDVSRTSVLGCIVVVLYFVFNYKEDENGRKEKF